MRALHHLTGLSLFEKINPGCALRTRQLAFNWMMAGKISTSNLILIFMIVYLSS